MIGYQYQDFHQSKEQREKKYITSFMHGIMILEISFKVADQLYL